MKIFSKSGALNFDTKSAGVLGIGLFVLATLFLALMDASTKLLAKDFAVPLIVTVRYMGNLVIIILIALPKYGIELFRCSNLKLVTFRALSLSLGSLCMGLALQRLPQAEATSIVFLAPSFVVIFAGLFLSEKIGFWGWLSALLGFVGVFIVARPSGHIDLFGAFLCLICAVMTATYQITSRVLAKTENNVTIQFYTSLIGIICFSAMLPFIPAQPIANHWQLGLFVFVGVVGLVGHFLFTEAHKFVQASTLAPLFYLQLVWAIILGIFLYNHWPHYLDVLGMMIIATAGLLSTFRRQIATLLHAFTLSGDKL